MAKSKLGKKENLQFDKAHDLHGKIEKILIECEEFKDWEGYHLLKDKLIGVSTLLNKLRTDSIKDPT